jgi:hypothetical protein
MVLNMRIKCGFPVLWLVFFLSIFAPFASLQGAEEQSSQAESIRRAVEQEALEKAMSAFNGRDYKDAKIGFEMLSENAQDPETARQALFGLAAVKLVLANTSEEYEDAISSWKKWSGQAVSLKGCEDPRIITPFLARLQPSISCGAGSPFPGRSPGQATTKCRKAAREAESKGVLSSKGKEMQTLRAKLELREREIRRLRLQLESLEEIHRKYQEKKQEATP